LGSVAIRSVILRKKFLKASDSLLGAVGNVVVVLPYLPLEHGGRCAIPWTRPAVRARPVKQSTSPADAGWVVRERPLQPSST
jgi:hypothetical protein